MMKNGESSERSKPLYSASLLFRSNRDGVAADFDGPGLWEESIILVEALSEADAAEEAARIGQSMESNYVALDGARVSWHFHKVERVFEIQDRPLAHGCEIFSRHLRGSEVKSLLTPFDDDAP